MAEEQWREVRFSYLVRDGVNADELEDRMIEACATLLGCDYDGDHDNCPTDWVASGGPMPED